MSYASKVKDELSRQVPGARHCQIAETAAIISLCGRVSISADDRFSIKIHTESVAVARKYFTLLRKTFNIVADVSIRRNSYLKKSRTYSVVVGRHEDAVRILMAAKLIGEDGEIGENLSPMKNVVVKQACCRRAFIRGAFLASGSISDPEKSYHFEITCASEEKACQLQEIIRTFGLDARIIVRKKYFVVYMKEGSQIVDILNVMEAPVSLMDLENIRIIKEMRGQVNRQVNCETANINKTVSAAVKQLNDIVYIRDTIGLSKLPENLEEMARVRLGRPEASLKELGEALDPPVGKSGVNHRLRKLSAIAESLREKNAAGLVTKTEVGPSGKEEDYYD
ncbi:MAG: DNA-binding protein WhiA [Lachnospiraceae bacterium]|nr:DNA-binding protein WhiA [Lachnospiraceae bacterium]MDO5550089.1 DNA-binding protein WhiA [Lachnospiraceae bacterium]